MISYEYGLQDHKIARTGTRGSDSREALDLVVVADIRNFNERKRKPRWVAAHRRLLPL